MPSILEIGVEEDVYSLILRWELRPSLRKARVDSCETISQKSGEVRGNEFSRAGSCVEEDSDFERSRHCICQLRGWACRRGVWVGR